MNEEVKLGIIARALKNLCTLLIDYFTTKLYLSTLNIKYKL